MPYRLIQVGCGGRGRAWCSRFLPPAVEARRIEVVAAVDGDADALAHAGGQLGLPPRQRYTDLHRALGETGADACAVAVPPAEVESVLEQATDHGLHALCEAPVGDSLEAACRIAEMAGRAGVKVGVTLGRRFGQDVTTLRREIRNGRHGALNYLVCRMTEDRRSADGGSVLLARGVHHLDLLADLAGAPVRMLWGQAWSPDWSGSAGDTQALIYMQTENGRRVHYEAAACNAVGLSGWGGESIRAECERATLVLAHGQIECFAHDPDAPRNNVRPGEGTPVPLLERPTWSNAWLVEQFCDWLDGGDPMPTHIDAAVQSMALVAAAVQAARTGWPQKVQDLLAKTRKAAIQ